MPTEIDEATRIKIKIFLRRRRLNLLKQKQALMGVNVGPEIIVEIEHTEQEIKKLRRQLAPLEELKGFLEITLDEQYSPEKVAAARRALAAVLELPIDRVKVAFLREGSMVILAEMPQEAVVRLIALRESDDPVLKELKLQHLNIIEDLVHADLSQANLSGFDLFEAYLYRANLSRTDLSGADLRGANLSRADLGRANLSRAILRLADLSRADLSRADLSRADLKLANLSRAHLSRAILRLADLSGADLSGADLTRADLSGADLSRAALRDTNLSNVISNKSTKWP